MRPYHPRIVLLSLGLTLLILPSPGGGQEAHDTCLVGETPVVDLDPNPDHTFQVQGDTCAFTNSSVRYNGPDCSLAGIDFPGPDARYEIVLNEGNQVAFSLKMKESADLTLILAQKCGDSDACVVHSQGALGSATEVIPTITYPPGTYSLYIDSHLPPGTPGSCGWYNLTITGNNPRPEADLDLSVRTVPARAVAGRPLEYQLTVVNHGPRAAEGVVVQQVLPPGTRIESLPTECQATGRIVNCDFDGLAKEKSRTLSIHIFVESATRGTLVSELKERAFAVNDTDLGNNLEREFTPIDTDVDLHPQIPAPTVETNVASGCVAESGLVAGCDALYRVAVTNRGDSDATGVEITVTDSEKLVFPSERKEFMIDRIKPGATRSVNLPVSVLPETRGDASLTVEVTSAETKNTPVSRSSLPVTIGAKANLFLQKKAPIDSVIAGTPVEYILTVTNQGPSTVLSGKIEDDLPPTLSLSMAGDCPASSSQKVVCNFASLVPGSSRVFRFWVLVDEFARGTISNMATVVVASEEEIQPAEPMASSAIAVRAEADLRIEKVADPEPVVAGEIVTYTIAVKNLGDSGSEGGTMTHTLGKGLSVDTSPLDCHQETPGRVTCSFGSLAVGAKTDFTLSARVDTSQTTSARNSAEVVGNDPDPDPDNNLANAPTAVIVRTDLVIEGIEAPDAVNAGENLVYALVIKNDGPSDSSGGAVVHTVDPALRFVSSPDGCAPQGDEGEGDGTILCPFGALPVGEMVPSRFVMVVPSSFQGTLSNTATVLPNEGRPASATAETTVATRSDLRIEKTATPTPVATGGALTYTVTVTNDGPSDARGGIWTDMLPPELSEVMLPQCDGDASCTLDTLAGLAQCAFDLLAAGETLECAFQASAPMSPMDLLNQVEGSASDALEVSAEVVTPVVDPSTVDLALTKTASAEVVPTGNFLTYRLTVTHGGPASTAVTATLTDPLPASLQFVDSPDPDCGEAAGVVTCGPLDLGPDTAPEQRTRTLRVLVNPPLGATTVVNEAAVAGDPDDPADPVPGNNTGRAETPVVEAPPLLLPFFTPEGQDTLLAIHNPQSVTVPVRVGSLEGFDLAPRATKTLRLSETALTAGAVGITVLDGAGDPLGPDGQTLWGDFLRVNPTGRFASGDLLVATDSRHRPSGLCRSWDTRFLNGGAFDGGTDFVFFVTGTLPTDRPLAVGEVYTEAGTFVQRIEITNEGETAFLKSAAELIDIDGHGLLANFGAIEWRFAEGVVGNIATVFKAHDGQFSAGVPGVCKPDTATAAPQPPLILPHFEVDTATQNRQTTLFTVRNGGDEPVELRYEVLSPQGNPWIPQITETLPAHAVHTVNLARLLDQGEGFVRITLAGEDPLPPVFLNGDFFRVDGTHQSASGDVRHIHDTHQSASGDALVSLDEANVPPTLCQRWSQRFFNGGDFDGTTRLVFYLDDEPEGALLTGTVYDEMGMPQASITHPMPGRSFELSPEELNLATSFGVIDWDLGEGVKGNVSGIFQATGGYSVGLSAVCLDAGLE